MGSALAAKTKGVSKGATITTAHAQKAAAAMHKKYPAGKQTAAQLNAERANLKIARQAVTVQMANWVVRKVQWQTQFSGMLRPKGVKNVLGSSMLRFHSSIAPRLSRTKFQAGTGRVHRPTGLNRRAPRAMGITRSGRWGLGRHSHPSHYLHQRSRRTHVVRGWKRRGGSLISR